MAALEQEKMGSYVFLDPDGSQEWGLVVIVAAATSVFYAHQCGGHTTALREIDTGSG